MNICSTNFVGSVVGAPTEISNISIMTVAKLIRGFRFPLRNIGILCTFCRKYQKPPQHKLTSSDVSHTSDLKHRKIADQPGSASADGAIIQI